MTDDKYKCLVKAMEDSGVTLPPIQLGTIVTETSPVPREPGLPPIPGESVQFRYDGAGAQSNGIFAIDDRPATMPRTKIVMTDSYDPAEPSRRETSINEVNVATGKEQNIIGQSLRSGTVSETVDKLIKCRNSI